MPQNSLPEPVALIAPASAKPDADTPTAPPKELKAAIPCQRRVPSFGTSCLRPDLSRLWTVVSEDRQQRTAPLVPLLPLQILIHAIGFVTSVLLLVDSFAVVSPPPTARHVVSCRSFLLFPLLPLRSAAVPICCYILFCKQQ